MQQIMRRLIRWGLATILLTPTVLHAGEPNHDALFHIERNTNANIVQYDALVGADGTLYSKEPVVAYWVRLAEQGQVKELTWIQRKFAYGFKLKLDKDENTATLELVADLGRTILVKLIGEDYRAVTDINGVASYVDRIFIHATGKGMSTQVDYIELYGTAVNEQNPQYERFSP